jgi:signal transduction histidine kinase
MENATAAQQREFFNVITTEAVRLGRLLDDLLNLQQLQAGSMTLQSANFDVLRMLHEVEAHIQPLVEERGLKLVSRVAPNVKPIYADKEKLTACLINLLGNAVKYTNEGEIRLIAEQLPGALVISVEDTGIGIAEENLPKLFDRFFRCPDERVQLVEGNGLGLAFAREVVSLHNGQLTVESELNQGSRFTVRIPLPSN